MTKSSASDRRDEYLDEGEQHFFEGRYEQALSCFDSVAAADEDDAEGHFLRARTLYYLERFEEAESAYDRALDVTPDYAAALIHKAELLLRAFDSPEQALQLLDDAERAETHPDDMVDAAFVRGLALMEMAEYRDAHEPLNRAVRGDGEWPEALRERGVCRFYLWRFEDARRDLERTLALDPEDAEAHHYLAMTLERIGLADAARAAFERASELEPDAFCTPCRMSRSEFEQVASDAIEALPDNFQCNFDNLSFAVEDLPDRDEGIQPDGLGVFVGRPITERSVFDVIDQPSRIRLFQKNLERISPDRRTLMDEISKTVLHEVGHYFGLGEPDMERLQIH